MDDARDSKTVKNKKTISDFFDDVSCYLDIDDLTSLSFVSTSSYYYGLNNLRHNIFIPSDNGQYLLDLDGKSKKTILKAIKADSNFNYKDRINDINALVDVLCIYKDLLETANQFAKKMKGSHDSHANNVANLINLMREDLTEIVKTMIIAGYDVNMKNYNVFDEYHYEETLLHTSVGIDVAIVDILIKAGADVNAKDKIGQTSFYRALIKNDVEIIKVLIEYVNIDEVIEGSTRDRDSYTYGTPLMYTICRDRVDIVNVIIDAGANINLVIEGSDMIRNKAGQMVQEFETPLFICVRDNKPEIASILIDSGADINLEPNEEMMIDMATRFGNTEIVELLTKARESMLF